MNVLSLFDGISCGMLALQRAGIKINQYYASEIDKYAIQISKKNFPEIIQLGDINNWENWKLPKIDLIMGGSPCTNLSNAGDRTGLEGSESSLFYKFVDIIKFYNPKYFLLENVKMKKEWKDIMSKELGVEPILINSALVSAQNRERLYWINFKVEQPEDSGILLKDIVFDVHSLVYKMNRKEGIKNELSKALPLCSSNWRGLNRNQNQNCVINVENLIHSEKALEYMNRQIADGRNHWDFGHFLDVRNSKSSAVVANFFKGVPYNVFKDWGCVRKFHPIECERLQTLPDNYTEGVSDTQRYKMIGNGWTIDVIAHILKYIDD